MRAEEEAARARSQLSATQTDILAAVEAVHQVDAALGGIATGVGLVNELLGTIAADNLAQSSAIGQISVAIGTMDQGTQQNAAMVEETSAAARNLASEVDALSDRASRFNIGVGPESGPSALRARFSSPIRQLPAAAVVALVRPDTDPGHG